MLKSPSLASRVLLAGALLSFSSKLSCVKSNIKRKRTLCLPLTLIGDGARGMALRARGHERPPHVQGRGFQRDEGSLLVSGLAPRPHLPAGDESEPRYCNACSMYENCYLVEVSSLPEAVFALPSLVHWTAARVGLPQYILLLACSFDFLGIGDYPTPPPPVRGLTVFSQP